MRLLKVDSTQILFFHAHLFLESLLKVDSTHILFFHAHLFLESTYCIELQGPFYKNSLEM